MILDIPKHTDFPIENIPFGVISTVGTNPRPATAIGDFALDLSVLAQASLFDGPCLKSKQDVFMDVCLL